jgi:hypothetical protein
MVAALQQQQLKNEAAKMALRVPLFYGNEKRHHEHQRLHLRFESACTDMGLNNEEEKFYLFGSYLIEKTTVL